MKAGKLLLVVAAGLGWLGSGPVRAAPKIHVAFLWHMHQPIYWPYESVVETAAAGRWSFDVLQVHFDRGGPYTAWPLDAVGAGLDLAHLGAQVSFSGSLTENLAAIESAGMGFAGWSNRWREAASWQTTLGNPRVDLVALGYHHPVLPLIPARDRVWQLRLHRLALKQRLGQVSPSRGLFPPETAFAEHIVPQLAAAGIEWVIVDNIHFDRARPDYPYSPASNLAPPNPAEQRNSSGQVTWVQLHDLWAPSAVSVPWGYQPHWVEYVDPESGTASRDIVVPAARYEGNEDARGGFGAFLYEQVMSQYEGYNTDPAHPMLVVLHHDGDNYGGGSDSYYHGNFSAFLDWLRANPERFECTTVQDYLDRFPPAADDVIHVEPGSWSGADNGDAEFGKWNGDPDADGWSPDRHSWAAVVAAANRVHQADDLAPAQSAQNVMDGVGTASERAWHFLLNAETSCYWYWDGAEGGTWDSHPSRAANLAVAEADSVLAGAGVDPTPPEVFLPQREPYNPGGLEWGGTPMPADFTVWTLAYDVSGLDTVNLMIRVDPDGRVDAENLVYAGGGWQTLPMVATTLESRTDPPPRYKADLYSAQVLGVREALVDYYVEARDGAGNVARTPIQHVWVGAAQPAGGVGWSPNPAGRDDVITVWGGKAGWLHWGVDGWQEPPGQVWPPGSQTFGDGKSLETPLEGPDAEGRYSTRLGPFRQSGVAVIDFVMHYTDGSWDNNGGNDYHIILHDQPADGGDSAGDDGGPGEPDSEVADGDADGGGWSGDGEWQAENDNPQDGWPPGDEGGEVDAGLADSSGDNGDASAPPRGCACGHGGGTDWQLAGLVLLILLAGAAGKNSGNSGDRPTRL